MPALAFVAATSVDGYGVLDTLSGRNLPAKLKVLAPAEHEPGWDGSWPIAECSNPCPATGCCSWTWRETASEASNRPNRPDRHLPLPAARSMMPVVNWHQVIDERNFEMDQVIVRSLRRDPTQLSRVELWIQERLSDGSDR